MIRLTALNWLALILVIVGGLNWGLVGVANFDLVAFLFGVGTALSKIVYTLVGVAAVYLAFVAITNASNKL